MKITFITDSYGGIRIHDNIEEVSEKQTFPALCKAEFIKKGHEVSIDYASYRKVTDLSTIMDKYKESDLFILHAGIVDAYPRPLNQRLTMSKAYLPNILRRLIRIRRKFVINYIYNKPWTSEKDYFDAIRFICKNYKTKMLWINVPKVIQRQEKETPGSNKAIGEYNGILNEALKNYQHCTVLNINQLLCDQNDFESFFHPIDSHLNIKGNKFYADEILKYLDL
jgi:hypothetical protein